MLWLDFTLLTAFTRWSFEKEIASCLDSLDLSGSCYLLFSELCRKCKGRVCAGAVTEVPSKSLSGVSAGAAEHPEPSLVVSWDSSAPPWLKACMAQAQGVSFLMDPKGSSPLD